MAEGRFFTFEGPEGCGKTTQIGLLVSRLEAAGHEVVLTREPGGTPTGEIIRDILQHDHSGEPITPRAEVMLFNASRAQLVEHVILPALERGAIVISDRFADSTTAYQGFGRGFDLDTILAINAFAVGDAVPDATFLLDLPVAEGLKRIQGRYGEGEGPDRIEQESLAFHERVRAGYLDLAARWPDRFRKVSANQEPHQVHETIWEMIGDVLGP